MKALKVWRLIAPPDPVGLELVVLPKEIMTLDGASLCLPGGAYTTLRTYYGDKVLHFADHIHRLEETAFLAGQHHQLDQWTLRAALRKLIKDNPKGKDVRIRLTLGLEHLPGDLYIIVEPLIVPPTQAYQEGVRVITCDIHR